MRIPPAVVLAAAAAGQRVVARRGRRTAGSVLASAAIAGLSGALALEGVAEFARHRTTVDPGGVERASALVTTGPSALTRNPMYAGMLGLLVARAVSRRSGAALLPALGFWWVIDRFQIPAEEEALAERFGQEYADYCERVPRWLWRGEAYSRKPAGSREEPRC
ncbi:methyltransferase family protein [Actinomyces bowdenii]|uniref:methyltransferase family protein n=1 Tax=Actinomyces bowdenii TaxID=131109 RepID=UPI001FB86335|nr:isoprenylcysteine carboxylmethyltransferase family protein [Actinomyces bowdenii]